jgi:DMSO reductase anchor subunit
VHPALSVILFTVASGTGYGLAFWLGLGAALGLVAADRWFGLVALGLALALISFGLLASTFHLGHPERAWRAFSQWRSSWLSREGVLAVATYVPLGLFALGWVGFGRTIGWTAAAGLVTAILALATVAATAMIYASLKTIPRWSNGWVVPGYLVLGAMAGGLWLAALLRLFGEEPGTFGWVAALLPAVGLLVKLGYWRAIDGETPAATAAGAIGLKGKTMVRLLDPPHTSENYVMKEMGFRIARKHAGKLRRIAVLLGFGVPLVLALLAQLLGGGPSAVAGLLAAIAAMAGLTVERWLFFAEAKHVVTLYYGAERV